MPGNCDERDDADAHPAERVTTMRRSTLLLAVLAISARPALGGEPPKAARWLSPETAIYLEIPRPEALWDRVSDERLKTALEASPQYRNVAGNSQLTQAKVVLGALAFQLGTTTGQGLRDLGGGGLVVGVEGPDRVVLAVTPKDPAFLERAHKSLVDFARKDAAKNGRPDPVKEAEYKGVKGFSVSDKEAHAVIDGTLLVATGGEALKSVIDRIQDASAKNLSQDADWTSARGAAREETVAWSFVRLDRLRELDPKRFGKDAKPNPGALFLLGPWVESLQKSKWAALRLDWTDGRLGAELLLPRPAGGYSPTFARYIPPKSAGAPGLIEPPGTIASLALWRDLASIWEVRGEIFPPESQASFAQLDSFAGTFFGGRDFESGVLGSLSNQWRLIVARQDAKALDPKPDVILPAFALVIDLNGEDVDFSQRLQAAFQSFVGLSNLGAAQQKSPPLMLGSETFEGVTLLTSRYIAPRTSPAGEPVNGRFNFSPAAAQVDTHFILSSSVGLARDLIRSLKNPPPAGDMVLEGRARGAEVASLVEQNLDRLVEQNMLEKGNDRKRAEGEIAGLTALLRYLGQGSITAHDDPDRLRIDLHFDLAR